MDAIQKNCPACATTMREIKATSTYGASIYVNQCDQCGGLWFDSLEIYQVKMGEGSGIEGIDTEKLRAKSIFTEGAFHCPNDGAMLVRFKDPYFPTSLHIDNCPKCGGFWMNRGEFAEFQKEREAIIEKNNLPAPAVSEEDKKFNEQMSSLLATNSDTGISDSVGSFANFLSTPIDPMTNRPFSSGAGLTGGANTATDIAFGILNIIFRLFLR